MHWERKASIHDVLHTRFRLKQVLFSKGTGIGSLDHSWARKQLSHSIKCTEISGHVTTVLGEKKKQNSSVKATSVNRLFSCLNEHHFDTSWWQLKEGTLSHILLMHNLNTKQRYVTCYYQLHKYRYICLRKVVINFCFQAIYLVELHFPVWMIFFIAVSEERFIP